jgi:hypothetical protein
MPTNNWAPRLYSLVGSPGTFARLYSSGQRRKQSLQGSLHMRAPRTGQFAETSYPKLGGEEPRQVVETRMPGSVYGQSDEPRIEAHKSATGPVQDFSGRAARGCGIWLQRYWSDAH